MERRRNHLNILFRRVQPEALLDSMRQSQHLQCCAQPEISSKGLSRDYYRRYAREDFHGFSDNEIDNLYQDMVRLCSREGTPSVFQLLRQYADDVLRLQNRNPVCRTDEFMGWHEISFRLGQDIFSTALLAAHDAQSYSRTTRFDWPTILPTDDYRLQAILQAGVSENHFHLGGSTQVFTLSWLCLMNCPRLVGEYLSEKGIARRMKENLQSTASYSARDRQLPWIERLYYAAALRTELFKAVVQAPGGADVFQEFDDGIGMHSAVSSAVECLRFRYGERFSQPDGSCVCLDYAIPPSPYHAHNRVLTGERRLLYHCFLACYTHCFTRRQQDMLYLYLLIKAQFRNELIQLNERTGFQNFSAYQNRKSDFWDKIPAYEVEAERLSVLDSMANGSVISLETRIAPAPTALKNCRRVFEIDRRIQFSADSGLAEKDILAAPGGKADAEDVQKPYFYVIHFIKDNFQLGEEDQKPLSLVPRNAAVRKKAAQCAKALAKALSTNGWLCGRIRGIDAANHEIGCRPETFATEFRFLRGFVPDIGPSFSFQARRYLPCLHATYHVGEDFLDIADGLRAIDETVRFLLLERGDRLGHALALGVDPEQHFLLKQWQMVLPAQDRLDNLVWLLYRSLEFGVQIDAGFRSKMEGEAQLLFDRIYRSALPEQACSLFDYYQSWKLRGDSPSLYLTRQFIRPDRKTFEQYDRFLYVETAELQQCRNNREATILYHAYHFDLRVKEEGQKQELITVDSDYIELLRQMQQHIQEEIARLGIAVECNPTSNYLIGTFQRYDAHPLLRFHPPRILPGDEHFLCLSISVNTDDKGVFDTSLENEYALIAGCLRWQGNGQKRKYSDDEIYDYLDHIREMGNQQVFPVAVG